MRNPANRLNMLERTPPRVCATCVSGRTCQITLKKVKKCTKNRARGGGQGAHARVNDNHHKLSLGAIARINDNGNHHQTLCRGMLRVRDGHEIKPVLWASKCRGRMRGQGWGAILRCCRLRLSSGVRFSTSKGSATQQRLNEGKKRKI